MAFSTLSISWSLPLIASRNWAWLMTKRRASVSVVTVAVATPRSSMLISPKKSPGFKAPPAFAVDLDLGFAVQKDVKRVALTILARERFSGRHTYLVTLFPDELQFPLREAGEERNPAYRFELGVGTHLEQHILLPWCGRVLSAASPSPTARASAPTAARPPDLSSKPKSGRWSRSCSPTWSTRPASPSASTRSVRATFSAGFSTQPPMS